MLTTPAPDPAAPRVLLFGHPRSGKTHLLGALLRASETQPDALGAEVIDPTGRLAVVRDAAYAGAAFEPTHTEVTAIPVFLRAPGRAGPVAEFALFDCDGRASTAILKHADVFEERRVTGTVAKAVLGADLIALVVDAGLTDDDLNERFEDFLFFLEQVHGRRLREREVGGLPVFVVLARTDVLAKPGDTAAEWQGRVRGNMRFVLKQFEEFIDDQLPLEGYGTSYLPFGSVDVEGFATAVRAPALADDPTPPAVPVGVAELFRAAFAAAAAHRARAQSSDRRLRRTVWAVAAGVALMVAGAAAVAVFQPPPADPELADRVKRYARVERPAAERLSEKNLARTARALTSFRNDAGYSALPADLQQFVAGRLREAEAYRAYRTKLLGAAAPADARTLDDLERVRTHLTTDLALPAEYTWGETDAARLRDKWLADVALIRAGAAAWADWFRGLTAQAAALRKTAAFDGDWRDRVNALAAAADRPPFAPDAPLPGAVAVPQPRGEAVTYRVPFEFDGVYQARRDWAAARAGLLDERDLADALALTPGPAPDRRPLWVPPPALGLDVLTFPAEQLVDLRTRYPAGAADDYPGWELAGFPDPARAVLLGRVRASATNAAVAVRGLVRAQLGTDDTPEGWARVAAALPSPPFRDWGRLLHVLARLENRDAPDPVVELATFLRTPEFRLDLRGVEVLIPSSLRPGAVPGSALTLTLIPRGGGPAVVRTYPRVGEPRGDALARTYPFGAADPLTVRPGDALRAELPLAAGGQAYTLVWDAGATRTFPLDRLAREPRLVGEGGVSAPATGVTLAPAPGSTLPRVPGLMPEVR